MTGAAPTSTNWQALLSLKLLRGEHRTQLVPLERYGPLSVQRAFYPEGECCHVYLLHPPGGVVGGDSIELQLAQSRNTKALLTTPGATKFYFSAAETAFVTQKFDIDDDAELEYLPQENIYFPGARVETSTAIDVKPGGKVLLWEKHCFGRPANRESFTSGQLHSRITLSYGGRPVFIEKQRLTARELQCASGLRNLPVLGNFILFGIAFDDDLVKQLRQISTCNGVGGITRIDKNLIIARYLGNTTIDLNDYFVRLWEITRPFITNRSPCHPRIWNT